MSRRTMRPVGSPTRGTTAPNRLRRVDTWMAARLGDRLANSTDPLIVDLGFGASPVTTTELAARLQKATSRQLTVVGLEIDPERVATAAAAADPPRLTFAVGGFELAGLRPDVVRAMNVLRQYEESAVAPAWRTMLEAMAGDGLLIEGTCDETGRLGCWIEVDRTGPRTLTLSADLGVLDADDGGQLRGPARFAQRLPKALIHHNVPGEPIHALLDALSHGWRRHLGDPVRRRWSQAVDELRAAGWPVVGGPARWRLGEVTVRWSAVAPRS